MQGTRISPKTEPRLVSDWGSDWDWDLDTYITTYIATNTDTDLDLDHAFAVVGVFLHTRNTKMSMIEAIKTKINNHQVPALDQVWGTVSYRPMGFNGLIIGFDSHIKELSQVKVGTSFKLCSGKPIVKYRLIVESEQGKIKFNWKDGVKPSDWLKIERDLLLWRLFG